MPENWKDEYQRKMTTPEEAVKVVKDGDFVVFPAGREPLALCMALLARAPELKDVRLFHQTPTRDLPWLEGGFEDSFTVEIGFVLPIVQQMMQEKRCDFHIGFLDFAFGAGSQNIDVLMAEVSPPDAHGFCSFGISIWNKKEQAQRAKVVIAEVNQHLIRTYGSNYIHISEIDKFVEHTPSGRQVQSLDLLGRKVGEAPVPDHTQKIARFVNGLIKDGDTVQVGAGTVSERLVAAGVFNGKSDLGWHSEATAYGAIKMMRSGQISGKYKSINRWKHIATAFGGGDQGDTDWITMNPLVELHSAEYVDNVLVIAQHENMKAINQALAVDLTGQIASESFGPRMYSGTGGQAGFAIGSVLSKGGRSITVLPSSAQQGKLSRIVAMHQPGTIVTVPRTVADVIVTEHGIAELRGKTQRQRAEALIEIAHPDHRAELRKQAREMFWP